MDKYNTNHGAAVPTQHQEPWWTEANYHVRGTGQALTAPLPPYGSTCTHLGHQVARPRVEDLDDVRTVVRLV